MSSSPSPDPAYQVHAKEYARFCRLRRLFLADGLETWHRALQERGLPEEEIRARIAAAALFVRSFRDPF